MSALDGDDGWELGQIEKEKIINKKRRDLDLLNMWPFKITRLMKTKI